MEQTLSFCLIACDEEARLEGCLNSVRDLCCELLVVDTGSTDSTIARARDLNARVVTFAWTDDFAEARNFGLSQLTGDWVLMLDADERLFPEVIPDIRHLIQQPDALVINLMRRELGASQSPWSLVSRLFRRHPAIRFERPYHAMVDDSVENLLEREPHWRIHDLGSPAIAHDGYRPEEIAGRHKADRARRAMERYHAAHPDDAYVCAKLGALLHSLGEAESAESLFLNGLEAVGDSATDAHLRHELHYHMGLLLRSQDRIKQARAHYRRALELGLDPRLTVGALFNLAALDQQDGLLDEAINRFKGVVELVPDLPQAHTNLGLALRAKGDVRLAEFHYRRALQADPDYADAYRNLGVLLFDDKRTSDALECFAEALKCYDRRDPEQAATFREMLTRAGLSPGSTSRPSSPVPPSR